MIIFQVDITISILLQFFQKKTPEGHQEFSKHSM